MDSQYTSDVINVGVTNDGATNPKVEILKVSTRSRPSAVAGAIAGVIRDQRSAEIQTIGAGATSQAVKAIAIAHNYLAAEQIEIVCVPAFMDVMIENEERTAIRLLVVRR
jgi:stage V sporulation protein S